MARIIPRGTLDILYCDTDLILRHMAESIIISGLPMATEVNEVTLHEDISETYWLLDRIGLEGVKREKIVKALGNAEQGSGHDSFLKGIILNAVISAPSYWYPQMQRYHFIDIISSQSKMHRITRMNLREQCTEEVDDAIIDTLNKYIELFNKEDNSIDKETCFRKIIANCPMGLKLTCGITTNYLQLKSMYNQRHNHKLDEWSVDFVRWAESLPFFKELCLSGK